MSKSEQTRTPKVSSEHPMQTTVEGKASKETFWAEQTKIIAISRLGATFYLQRECLIGRLVLLNVSMPIRLRTYDFDKKIYRVWGLIQNCSPVLDNDTSVYSIAVAFVGKNPPSDYFKDPQLSYKISGTGDDGFWNIVRTETPFIKRAFHRFPYSLEASVATIDGNGKETWINNPVVTENIGIGGTSVFSELEIGSGECVKFSCENPHFTSISVVCKRKVVGGEPGTLHLEFFDPEFPIVKVRG